ncbi:abortive infection family protein [Virgibacillus natechei]
MKGIPLTDEIIISLSQLIDDSQIEVKREPTHSDLEFHVQQVGLWHIDPKNLGKTVGKAKRVREILYWALENNTDPGERLVFKIISNVRAVGGFREESKNYTGPEAIQNVQEAFKSEGYILTSNGEVHTSVLENLSEQEMEEFLKSYIKRAKRGIEDAALVTGTGKDLLEAVAAHVLLKKTGTYPEQANFPTLLGQAFTYLNLATTYDTEEKDKLAQRRFEYNFDGSLIIGHSKWRFLY